MSDFAKNSLIVGETPITKTVKKLNMMQRGQKTLAEIQKNAMMKQAERAIASAGNQLGSGRLEKGEFSQKKVVEH